MKLYSFLLCYAVYQVMWVMCAKGFLSPSLQHHSTSSRKTHVTTMVWKFSKPANARPSPKANNINGDGSKGKNGELYFVPSREVKLLAPESSLGQDIKIPLCLRNTVAGPYSKDRINAFEMKYRQLFNNVGIGGTFGLVYYSQDYQKIALVGTLAKVTKIERIEEGGMFVTYQGVGRFFVNKVTSEKPYVVAKVKTFMDYSMNPETAETAEISLFNEIRYSVKLFQMLQNQNNYTVNESVLKFRPPNYGKMEPDFRLIKDQVIPQHEIMRKSLFSFAAMDMMKSESTLKLSLVCEPVVERRLIKMVEVSLLASLSVMFFENYVLFLL